MKLNDFKFGDIVRDKSLPDIPMVVVAIQPENGPGAIICFEEDVLYPSLYSPEDLEIITTKNQLGLIFN